MQANEKVDDKDKLSDSEVIGQITFVYSNEMIFVGLKISLAPGQSSLPRKTQLHLLLSTCYQY